MNTNTPTMGSLIDEATFKQYIKALREARLAGLIKPRTRYPDYTYKYTFGRSWGTETARYTLVKATGLPDNYLVKRLVVDVRCEPKARLIVATAIRALRKTMAMEKQKILQRVANNTCNESEIAR